MTVVDEYQEATERLASATTAAVRAIYMRVVNSEISREDAVYLIAAQVNQANAQAVTLADVYLAAQIEAATGVPTPPTGVVPDDASARLVKAARTILFDPAPPAKRLTRAEVEQRIVGAGLDPADWKIPAITDSVNYSIREMEEDRSSTILSGEDFIETVSENPAHPDAPVLNSDDFTDVVDVWEAEEDGGSIGRLERLARSEPLEAAQDYSVNAMEKQHLVEGWTRQMDASPCQLCRWWWRDGRVWPKKHRFQRHKGCNCQPKIVLAQHIRSTIYTRQLERNKAS